MLTLSARLCCWARLKQQRILFFSYTPHRWRSRVAASGWSKRSSGRHTRAATLQRQHVAVRPWCPPGGRARVCVCVCLLVGSISVDEVDRTVHSTARQRLRYGAQQTAHSYDSEKTSCSEASSRRKAVRFWPTRAAHCKATSAATGSE